MNKKQLSERGICTKFITPSLRQAGWDEMTQLREEVSFTNAGEYYTPRAVTAFMTDRIDPHAGEILLDPACGTGGLVIMTWPSSRVVSLDRALLDLSR
jgi:hypothetical protein